MILRLRYIQRVRDRRGKTRLYFRRPGHKSKRLPAENDPGFLAAYNEALATGKPETLRPKEPPRTLAGLIDVWMRSARFAALAETTRSTYRRILLDMQKQDYANAFVTDFQPVYVRRILARHTATPAAATNRLKILRVLFDHAVSEGWRPDNPASAVKRHKEKAEGAVTWTEEQIDRYDARWPQGSIQRLALTLLVYTGQRRSDVVRMGSADRRGNLLEVRQQKTGARLLIPIHPRLAQELDAAPATGTFLQTPAGKAYTANGFYMRFREWRAAAELPEGLSPHGLRKAAARRLAEAGCTTHQIAAITGHATLAEVERYTRAVDQEKLARSAIERIKL